MALDTPHKSSIITTKKTFVVQKEVGIMKSSIKYITIILIVAIFASPSHLFAQRIRQDEQASTPEQAIIDAEQDAEIETPKVQWLGCGCIGVYLGVGAAYFMVPGPKEDRLIGKSSDYVYMYSQAYRNKRRSIQTRYATIGCAISTVIATVALIWAVNNEEIECCGEPDIQCGPDISCGSIEGCSDSEDGCSSGNSCSGD
jgi:hypothetical protein